MRILEILNKKVMKCLKMKVCALPNPSTFITITKLLLLLSLLLQYTVPLQSMLAWRKTRNKQKQGFIIVPTVQFCRRPTAKRSSFPWYDEEEKIERALSFRDRCHSQCNTFHNDGEESSPHPRTPFAFFYCNYKKIFLFDSTNKQTITFYFTQTSAKN